jgi:hypothetical protein
MNNGFTAEPTISLIAVSKYGLSDFSTIVNPVVSMIIRHNLSLAYITDTQADTNVVAVCAQTCTDNWSGICRSISRISFRVCVGEAVFMGSLCIFMPIGLVIIWRRFNRTDYIPSEMDMSLIMREIRI